MQPAPPAPPARLLATEVRASGEQDLQALVALAAGGTEAGLLEVSDAALTAALAGALPGADLAVVAVDAEGIRCWLDVADGRLRLYAAASVCARDGSAHVGLQSVALGERYIPGGLVWLLERMADDALTDALVHLEVQEVACGEGALRVVYSRR